MKQLIIIIFSLTMSGCCAIVGLFPSHEGRVVDLSTKEPIQGAAVLAIYNTSGLDHTEREDAIEIVTDKNGHFKIPWNLIFTFRVLGGWDDSPQIFIYKPGYGCFPRYIKERVIRDSNGAELHGDLPAGIPVTIELDKLTPEELKWKSTCFTHGVPYEKMRELTKLEFAERVSRGFERSSDISLFLAQPDMYMAILENDLRHIRRLLSKGLSVNASGENGYTPLMFAAKSNRYEIADLLISRGASIDAQDVDGNTSLRIASYYSPRIANLFIEKNANINLANNSGLTSLNNAIVRIREHKDYEELAILLLKQGAKVDVKGDNGRANLYWARFARSAMVVELLLSHGAKD